MIITASKHNLLSVLKPASAVAENNPVVPSLKHLLFKANGKCTIYASDTEVSLLTTLEADIKQEGSICVPAKTFLLIAKEMEAGELTVETLPNLWVKITTPTCEYKLAGLAEDDFPPIQVPDQYQGTINSKSLAGAFSAVTYAIMNNEAYRPALQGVYIEKGEIVATDGCRLARVTFSEPLLPHKVILSEKGVRSFIRAFGECEEEVQWAKVNNNLVFSGSQTTLSIRTINADYPDYKSILQINGATVVLPINTFMSWLNLCEAIGADNVWFKGEGKKIRIIAQSGSLDKDELSGDFEVSQGKFEGEIGFQVKYLLEPIEKAGKGETLRLCLKPEQACGMKFTDVPNFLYLLMPLALKGKPDNL